jgi:invasion protein IalB
VRNLLRLCFAMVIALVLSASSAMAAQTSDLAEIASLPAKISNYVGQSQAFVNNGTAPLFQNGAPQTAPTAATVLVDSGQLAPGCYLIDVHVANETDTAVNTIACAHRNAANAADISVAEPFGLAVFATIPILASVIYEVQIGVQNERVACRIVSNATAAKIWQADMVVWPCP